MSVSYILPLIVIVLLTALFAIARWLHVRSMRLKSQLQLNNVYTNITQELLTPLAILSASVEKLRTTTPANREVYDLMDLNIQRSVRLLQQMQENGKSGQRGQELLVSNSDIMQFIKETARSIQPLMQSKHLTFTIRCMPESMMGWTDTDKLGKMVFHLLSNAAQNTEEGGTVELEASTNTYYDHITVRISDNGQTHRHDIIDADYGLTLARRMAYLHRGNFYSESYEGQGTTFIVDLPISKESFLPSEIDENRQYLFNIPQNVILDLPTDSSELQAALAGDEASRILLVESNQELLNLMSQLLQHRYRVLTASNGREALEAVYAQPVDLIVADAVMPEMSGHELTIQIKQNQRYGHLPVILITSKTREDERLEALSAGADDIIMKPFKMRELQMHIDNIIANRQRIYGDTTADPSATGLETISSTPLSADNEFLQRAIRCINEHISDTEYDREAFASDMGSSISTLYNKLRAVTGKSVTNFIRDIRIKEACRLARENPDLRVSDIAYRVGYKDPKYFATSFKRVMGIQPKEYFLRMREEVSGER